MRLERGMRKTYRNAACQPPANHEHSRVFLYFVSKGTVMDTMAAPFFGSAMAGKKAILSFCEPFDDYVEKLTVNLVYLQKMKRE